MISVQTPAEPVHLPPELPNAQNVELLKELKTAGFDEIPGGKGSHRKLVHPRYCGVVTLSGNSGDDAKPYQEKRVEKAIEEVRQ